MSEMVLLTTSPDAAVPKLADLLKTEKGTAVILQFSELFAQKSDEELREFAGPDDRGALKELIEIELMRRVMTQ